MEYFCRGRRKYVTKRGDQVERGFGREQTKVKGHGWDWKEKRERKTGLKQWRGKGVPQEDRSVVAHGHIEGIGRMGMRIDFIERAWIYSFVRASETDVHTEPLEKGRQRDVSFFCFTRRDMTCHDIPCSFLFNTIGVYVKIASYVRPQI